MFIIQLLVVLAMLSGSGSSSYATSTQMEIKSLRPQTASSELIMESGLKPFRAERDFKNLDPFEQATKILGKSCITVTIIHHRPHPKSGILDHFLMADK